tara:strand:- start:364 stop:957 length:594 start_codon:yes stop_codon:yes gene_type:complete
MRYFLIIFILVLSLNSYLVATEFRYTEGGIEIDVSKDNQDFVNLESLFIFCKYKVQVPTKSGKERIIDMYGYQEINDQSIQGACNYYLEFGDNRPPLQPNTYEELTANDYCYSSNVLTSDCNKMLNSLPDDLPEIDNINENTSEISESETIVNQEIDENSDTSIIMKKLQELKTMLDVGLISQEDYDKKKDEYLKDY